MSLKEKTRANEFDRRMGALQTRLAMRLGVGTSILDIGCGVGEFTGMFKERFSKVAGLDMDEDMIQEARKNTKGIEYFIANAETFNIPFEFDTISMNNLLEHVDNPVEVLRRCKEHLKPGGRIIAQVPNSTSITRELGVKMGFIDTLNHISIKEQELYGHKRVYTLRSLRTDFESARLYPAFSGGLLYKPLPNDALELLCKEYGEEWAAKFINALVEYGEDKPTECGYVWVCAA